MIYIIFEVIIGLIIFIIHLTIEKLHTQTIQDLDTPQTSNVTPKLLFACSLILLILLNIITIYLVVSKFQIYNIILIFIIFTLFSLLFIILILKSAFTSIPDKSNNNKLILMRIRKYMNYMLSLLIFLFVVTFSSMLLNPKRNGVGIDYQDITYNQLEFEIDSETTLHTTSNYLYIFSDFSCGLSIYDKSGDYISSFYYPYFRSGKSKATSIDNYIYVFPSIDGVIYAINDAHYYGKVEIQYGEFVNDYTIYDNNDVSLENFKVSYDYRIIGFDEDSLYFYNYDLKGYYKVDSTGINTWSGEHSDFDFNNDFNSDTYKMSGPNVYLNDDIIISTNVYYYIASDFMIHLIIGILLMAMLPLTRLPYKNLEFIDNKKDDFL